MFETGCVQQTKDFEESSLIEDLRSPGGQPEKRPKLTGSRQAAPIGSTRRIRPVMVEDRLEEQVQDFKLDERVVEAIDIAGTAINVLEKDLNDEKVQSMVKRILGDGEDLQAKVDIAKVRDDGRTYSKAQGLPLTRDYTESAKLCATYRPPENENDPVPEKPIAGLTFPAEGVTDEYLKLPDEWYKDKKGQIHPLDRADFVVPHGSVPSTMDICPWCWLFVGDGEYFNGITEDAIAIAVEEGYVEACSALTV
ncbi:hypothetical protein OQA88_9308 [Cercophora sp. LCS_1]